MLPNSAFYLNLIGGLAPEKRARRVESNIPSHTTWGPHGMWGCCKKSEILICFFLRTSWWAWFARYRWPLRALAHFPNFGDTLDRKNGLFDCYVLFKISLKNVHQDIQTKTNFHQKGNFGAFTFFRAVLM